MSLSSRGALPALAAVALALGTAAPAPAALIFYNTRASFDAAAPGLPVETFEEARVPPGGFLFRPGPLNSATNNGVFLPGEILPGLTIATAGPAGPDLVILGPGTTTGASRTVGAAGFANTLDLSFAPGVGAVGFELSASAGPGLAQPATFDIGVFGSGGLLGTTAVTSTVAQRIIFFGVVSDAAPITRVNVNVRGNVLSEFVDNVAFGTPGTAVVPEPASVGLLAAGAAVLAGFRRRRTVA